MTEPMNCPHCDTHIDEHEASPCFDLWIMQDVFGWTTSIQPYKGDFYPKGSHFVIWHQPDDFMPEICMIISQAFDKDGNNLRSTEENPFGMWDETPPGYDYSLQFSTDISATWEVVEKMKTQDMKTQYRFIDILYGIMKYNARFPKGGLMLLLLYVEPEDICRAAIKVAG